MRSNCVLLLVVMTAILCGDIAGVSAHSITDDSVPGSVPAGSENSVGNDTPDAHDHTHDLDGSSLISESRFVRIVDRNVYLRSADGRLIVRPLDGLGPDELRWVRAHQEDIYRKNQKRSVAETASPTFTSRKTSQSRRESSKDRVRESFDVFARSGAIALRSDAQYQYVESNGMPDHPMMIGIRSWQQQVPLPQKYTGSNAWQIPLQPRPAAQPASTKNRFLRGAIALAVNGIPIFNPLNNRGNDAFLAGELDEYGGHCGRADDYHYHLPPVHLEKQAGKGSIIAWALDGYPIYGFEEPDGSAVRGLDKLNGHQHADGDYHYHSTKTYPYLNGGFYGEVTERDDQVDPQPRAESPRPALTPLRDARITDFQSTAPGKFRLTYDVRGREGSVSYSLADSCAVQFVFVSPDGESKTETYEPRRRGPGERGRRPAPDDEQNRPPRGDRRKPPKDGQRGQKRDQSRTEDRGSQSKNSSTSFRVSSDAIDSAGFLSEEFTCDGASASPPVTWQKVPKETKFIAVSLWHTAPDQEKSYWLVYNIPASASGLQKNARNIGTTGLNDRRRAEFDAMCSKGPGIKTYHLTVYALSDKVMLPPDQATRARFLEAIQQITLAESTIDFQYERKEQ
ncbi:MAG: YHYH protein [Planctomyces sp.]